MADDIRLNPMEKVIKYNPGQGGVSPFAGLAPSRQDQAGMFDEANRDLRFQMYGAESLDAANMGQQGQFAADQRSAIKGSQDPNTFGSNQLLQAQNPQAQAMALAASTGRMRGGAGIKQALTQGIEGQQANIAAAQPMAFQEQQARLGQAIDFTGQGRGQDLAYEAQLRDMARNYEALSLDQQKAIMDRATALKTGQYGQQAQSYQQNAANKGAQLGAAGTIGGAAIGSGLFSSGPSAPSPYASAGQGYSNIGSFTA